MGIRGGRRKGGGVTLWVGDMVREASMSEMLCRTGVHKRDKEEEARMGVQGGARGGGRSMRLCMLMAKFGASMPLTGRFCVFLPPPLFCLWFSHEVCFLRKVALAPWLMCLLRPAPPPPPPPPAGGGGGAQEGTAGP